MKIISSFIMAALVAATTSNVASAAEDAPSLRGSAGGSNSTYDRNLQGDYPYWNPYTWLQSHSDDPNKGLSCVIRQANGANGGRVLTAKGNNVVVQGRQPDLKHQRWIIHNRRDVTSGLEGRQFLLWNEDSQDRSYLSTHHDGNVDMWHSLDTKNYRQYWYFSDRFINNRNSNQFTIAQGGNTDINQRFISNWGGDIHHVELTSRREVDNDDLMTWELIDCQEVPAPRFFYIRHVNSGQVLDIVNNDCNRNARHGGYVIRHNAHGGRNQQFFHGRNGAIMSRRCNQALVGQNEGFIPIRGSTGCPKSLQVESADGSDRQSWEWNENGPMYQTGGCGRRVLDPFANQDGRYARAVTMNYVVDGNRNLRLDYLPNGGH